MTDKLSQEDFLAKIEWEGGIESALEYGLTADDLNDQTTKLAKTWRKLERIYAATYKTALEEVEYLVDELTNG